MKTPFDSIGRTYRHINRYRQLITILIKYGFDDIVDSLNLSRYIEMGKSAFTRKPPQEIKSLPRAKRIRLIVEEMGTTYIKFAQILSTRPDLISQELIEEFTKLQDHVPPYPSEEAYKIIEYELDGKIKNLFKEISPEPIASASIAQVYRAVLPEGEEVAVKVKRPDIERIVEVDIEIMINLARIGENHVHGLEIIQPVSIIEEFARQLDDEMNLHLEAHNIERFAENLKDVENVHAMGVYRSHSSRAVLTTEFIRGTKISELKKLEKDGVDKHVIAVTGTNAVLKQIFQDGFFHGDPHPGNLFVTENKELCFIDFGMMGNLDRHNQEALAEVLVNIIQKNEEQITRSVLNVATNPDEITDLVRLKREILRFVNTYAYMPLDQLNAGEILQDLLNLFINNGIKLPPEYYLLIKAIATIEGIARDLEPDFIFMDYIKPYVERLIKQRYDPRRLASDMGKTTLEFYQLLREMPSEIREVFKFIKRGEVKIDLETKSLLPVIKTWDRDANRLAYAIVNASVLLSSSLIIMAHVPPQWGNVSIPGIIGVCISGLMSFRLLIAIFMSNHL